MRKMVCLLSITSSLFFFSPLSHAGIASTVMRFLVYGSLISSGLSNSDHFAGGSGEYVPDSRGPVCTLGESCSDFGRDINENDFYTSYGDEPRVFADEGVRSSQPDDDYYYDSDNGRTSHSRGHMGNYLDYCPLYTVGSCKNKITRSACEQSMEDLVRRRISGLQSKIDTIARQYLVNHMSMNISATIIRVFDEELALIINQDGSQELEVRVRSLRDNLLEQGRNIGANTSLFASVVATQVTDALLNPSYNASSRVTSNIWYCLFIPGMLSYLLNR